MSNRIAVAIPVVHPHPLIEKCLDSILAQVGAEPDVLLIRNAEECEPICAAYEKKGVSIKRMPKNLGVSASWNLGALWAWERNHASVALLNDDFYFHDSDSLSKAAASISDKPEHFHVFHEFAFSAFLVPKAVWDRVGPFDDGFWPAGYEDMDYFRRMALHHVKVQKITIKGTHAGGKTLRQGSWVEVVNSKAAPLNELRFVMKWGGDTMHPSYTTPWNGVGVPMTSTFGLLRKMGLIDEQGRPSRRDP